MCAITAARRSPEPFVLGHAIRRRSPFALLIDTLDVAEAFHFLKDDRVVGVAPDRHVGGPGRRMDHRDTLHSLRLLRVRRE